MKGMRKCQEGKTTWEKDEDHEKNKMRLKLKDRTMKERYELFMFCDYSFHPDKVLKFS